MPSISSVLDNIETFVHFLEEKLSKEGTSYSKFINVQHRKLNLSLANSLLNSSLGDEVKLNTTIKGLLCCSSISLLEKNQHSIKLIRHSKKCRSKYCTICSRQKSIKLASRLDRFLIDKSSDLDLERQGAYFMTLTLKHNGDVRNGIYIEELKELLYKLQRSTLWKRYFKTKDSDILTGEFRNIETTIGANGYHIHSHILIFCKKLSEPVKEVQKRFSEKWLKLTGDSNIVRLDLLRNKEKTIIGPDKKIDITALMPAIKEVVKYSTKIIAKKNELPKLIDELARYIIATKGVNFHNVSGDLRGNELTSYNSIWDEDFEPEEVNCGSAYFLARTSDIHFTGEKNFYSRAGKELIKGTEMIINKINGMVIKVASNNVDINTVMNTSLSEENAPDSWLWLADFNGVNINEKADAVNKLGLDDLELKQLIRMRRDNFILNEFKNSRPVEFLNEEIPF